MSYRRNLDLGVFCDRAITEFPKTFIEHWVPFVETTYQDPRGAVPEPFCENASA
jgi:hypothetical protein